MRNNASDQRTWEIHWIQSSAWVCSVSVVARHRLKFRAPPTELRGSLPGLGTLCSLIRPHLFPYLLHHKMKVRLLEILPPLQLTQRRIRNLSGTGEYLSWMLQVLEKKRLLLFSERYACSAVFLMGVWVCMGMRGCFLVAQRSPAWRHGAYFLTS